MSLQPYVHLDVALAGRRAGEELELHAEGAHHLTQVLRLRPGSPIQVADGRGAHAPARLTRGGVHLTDDPQHVPVRGPRLVLVQALPKARKLDEVVRVATELGVDRVIPTVTARSVVRLEGQRCERAVGRWRSIARAAAQQARRPHLPEVSAPVALAELPATLGLGTGCDADAAALLVATPGAPPLPEVAAPAAADRSVLAVAIGPEGGFTDDELDRLRAAGAHAAGLGAGILRTEHAGAAALAVLGALAGRWADT